MDQPPLPEIDPYVNRNLFSQHFLKELLPQDEAWQVDEDRLKLAMQGATNLYAGREEEWAGRNEPQLEDKLVRPMLQALGHKFEVQPSLPTPETVRRPDYAFFGTDEERLKAERDHDGQAEYFNKAIAIGDAKRWDRSLDKKERSGRDSFDMLSPSWQIDYYLRMSGVKWGILTNGRLWRLYNQDTSFRLDICYEIDLPRLLAAKDLEAFKYFYLFFRRQAFVPDAEGLCFLDRVYQGSLEYAQAVGDDLKENVYKALRLLAEGFLHSQGNNLDPVHDLDEIHANSLVLLYRLLFINYAEDRGLLPRDNALYRESYGLVSMEREIASKVQRRESLPALQVTYWEKLRTLFNLINQGTEALGIDPETMEVPPYNGGLFDPEKHPFLEQYKVEDKWLALVIDLLARSQGEGVGRGFVDYASLDVRHLGSIYEGLLEYKLRVADQGMVAIKRGGKEQWIPSSEAGSTRVLDRVEPGSVYLATDRGERKATGSYYTPDYIVKYIVEHTVGPLIEEKIKEDDPIEGILSLKVLDPAMGSGHFLVEATDRLAHALVQALGGAEQEPEEVDIRWARREVVERCVYGVDLNPLAVELAKLSLWLHTVAEGKPLNFLDHHLKVGNSLIGAWVDHLGSLPVPTQKRVGKGADSGAWQMNLFETRLDERLPVMLNKVLEIIRRRSDTLEDIKAKAAADQAVEQLRVPFKAVADLWVSTYFGSEVSEGEYQEALEHIGEPMQLLGLPSVRQADRVARDKHFFHWELEFPEVFYKDSTRQGNPGFDAILGNPPYVDSEEMTQSQPQLREYCTRRYGSAVGNWDLFVVFVELGITLSRRGGRSSLIVPNKLLGSEYCVGVHSLLRQKQVKVLRDYSRVRVFESSVYPVVYVVQNTVGSPTDVIELSQMSEGDQSRRPVEIRRGSATLEVLDRLPPGYWWPVFSPAFPVVRKALTVSWDLDQVARVVGAATVSEAYELADLVEDDAGPTTSTDSAVDRFKLLNTGTIDRYDCKWGLAPTTYLKNTYQHPVVQGPKLAQVSDTRLDQARSRKVILAGMSTRLEGFCDVDGTYLPGKSTVVLLDCLVDEQYLLAILNSTLCSLVYREIFGSLALQGGYLRVGPPQAARIPVRRIRFTTPAEERQRLAAHAEALFSIGDQAELIAFTSERLARAPEQADVIHDLLAHLAQQMTDMNREKNAEVKGFLDWLARYTGLPTEEWRLKTVVQAYWQHSWDELLRALGENRKAIEKDSGRNVEGREAQEAIHGEFEKSMTKLDPLLERIASTDRLIDLIVYRLYGLTEEEVAIIEGGV